MSYRRGRRYRRRSSNSFGSLVGDSANIASKFSPRGALITGVVGFVALYYVIPWLLNAWLEYNKAKMSNDAVGMAMQQFLDAAFVRRFVHPAEWAGIAVLLVCTGIAGWKAWNRTDLDYQGRRDMSFLARLVARFLD
ncbi:MAG TPA: hypothetical protein PLX20_00020 [Rhodocyclaceae bacterium]|nr:hypothetical protein [Rhodocyclaceae bacterium]